MNYNFQKEIKFFKKISLLKKKYLMSKDPQNLLSFILGNDSVLMNKQQKAM